MKRATTHSVTHATFTIERKLKSPPAKIFKAFSDPTEKKKWFSGPPEWGPDKHELDFRVGGREISVGGPPGGPVSAMEGRFWDIVADHRIVCTYDMHLDDVRISVSLNTIELFADGTGTRLVLTEAGAYLDGYDNPGGREEGTRALLDQLAKAVDD